ncbi:MAG: glycosyltransferase family 2 protein [Ruminococcaceae bacterium]|nr:glycosyltransferase family 2 protein [Oscillospiraceae bacterium]
MAEEIKVSIMCNAYNHENYIRNALEGFVMQKTNFAFEILIHDDASTDKTADIIREYEAKYPMLIKPIYQTENQYSKGIGAPRIFQEPRVQGKYIAFCEGDDYWTDPLKLQKQYDALEAHPEVDICAHASSSVDAKTGCVVARVAPADQDTILSAEDVIAGGGGYVATASLMYRTSLIQDLPAFRKLLRLDYTLQIHGALRGGMLYLADCMSVYRVMAAGSWSERMRADRVKADKHFHKVQEMLRVLNEDTEGKYEAAIQKKIARNEFTHFCSFGEYRRVLAPQYKPFLRELSRGERMKIYIKALFPFLNGARKAEK